MVLDYPRTDDRLSWVVSVGLPPNALRPDWRRRCGHALRHCRLGANALRRRAVLPAAGAVVVVAGDATDLAARTHLAGVAQRRADPLPQRWPLRRAAGANPHARGVPH